MTDSMVVYTFLSRREIPNIVQSTSFYVIIAWLMRKQMSEFDDMIAILLPLLRLGFLGPSSLLGSKFLRNVGNSTPVDMGICEQLNVF